MNLFESTRITVRTFENRLDLRGPCWRSSRRGFSLVETALALGVISFALISLLGLLPSGLHTFRKAMDCTLQTEMTQVLVGKVKQTSYTGLSQLSAQSYYFDDYGNLVTSTDTTATYVATVSVNSSVTLPSSSSNPNTGLALVTITFTRKQASASAQPLGTVVTYVAAMTGSSS